VQVGFYEIAVFLFGDLRALVPDGVVFFRQSIDLYLLVGDIDFKSGF
jgi:hypothetical protein